MKKFILSMAGVALIGSAWAVGELTGNAVESESPLAYGFLISDDSGRDVGLYTFPVENSVSPVLVAKSDDVSAGAMADGTYYAMTYAGSPATPQTWNTVDLATGAFTKLADCAEGAPLYVDMTYDYSRGKLMGIYHYGGNSTAVAEINPADGSVAAVYADLPMQIMVGIAASYEGEIYMVGRGNTTVYYTYKLDDSRKLQTVGRTMSMGDYMQSMEFDRKSGRLFWAGSSRYNGYMYEVNLTDGMAKTLTSVGSNGELTGMYIPFKLAADGTPAAARSFTVANPAHDDNITISFTVPGLTVDGKELGAITGWKILCDDTVLDVPFEAVTPGQTVTVNATAGNGLHVFKVILINAVGEGAPAVCKTYTGADAPAAPTSVKVSVNGPKADISWAAVTEGASGGWIDATAVTYNVSRIPDGKVIATGISATSVSDEVEKTDVYQYSVTVVCHGKESAAGVSDMVAVGDGIELPYECDFSNTKDLVMWTSEDVNADGYSWQYTANYGNPAMLVRSTFSYACDEWLISPALKLEAGKEYKISYNIGAMNSDYPPAYTLHFGSGATSEALTEQFCSESVGVYYPQRRIVYLPAITESGTYHIGVHAKWAAGYPALYFGGVKIEENHAARLALTVTDSEGKALGDASVSFEGKDGTYTTDADGNISVIEIDPGTYKVTIEKFGYITRTLSLTFAANEAKALTEAIDAIPATSISGTVRYAGGKPLGDASVYVNGYKDYTAVTAPDGSFSIEGVYATGSYSVEVMATNYLPEVITLDDLGDGPVNLGEIVLQEKLTAPANVKHDYDRTKVSLSWDAPVDKEESFRYDDGQAGLINSYSMSPFVGENTVTGTVYDTPAVFTGMSFKADNYKDIGIVVFDLDENGEPTTDILYEQTVKGDSWNWVDVTFTHPVVAPRGALFALRGDSRLYFDGNTDGTRNDGYPVLHNKMWLSYNYTLPEMPFHWQNSDGTGPLFAYNFCLRATGRPLGAPRKAAQAVGDSAPVVGYNVWRLPDGSQSSQADWTLLTESPVAEATYTDATWSNAAKGLYRYAVKAVYTGDEVSYPVFSEVVPRQLTSAVDVTLLSNAPGETTAAAKAVLVEKEGTHSYSAVADGEGALHFANVWEGTYVLTATCEGYADLSEEITVSGDEDFSASFTMTEMADMPFNIAADETGTETSRLLRWNFRDSYFEDFESYPDFTVHPTGDIAWSYIDNDGITDVSILNSRYEGIDAAAFVVMNSATSDNPRYTEAHSGERAIMSMASLSTYTPTDDYIISPELSLKGDFVVSFWIHSYWIRNDYYRVGYSMTGNSLGDFNWTDKVAVPDDKWINPVVNIPAGAKYVAINYGEAFRAGAIDDIYIGPAGAIPDVTAKAPQRVAGQAKHYEVYLDGNKLGETAQTEWLLENLAQGSHSAGVKAVYASGASEMALVNFVVGSSGIEGIDSGIRISTTDGRITVSGVSADDVIALCDIDGRSYPVQRVDGGATVSGLAKGKVYVLRINGQAYRMMF